MWDFKYRFKCILKILKKNKKLDALTLKEE